MGTNEHIESWMNNLGTCYYLAVAYSANLGGTAILSGSPFNIWTKELVDELWRENGQSTSPINYVSWMVLNVPASALTLLIMWGWFWLHFLVLGGCTITSEAKQYASIQGDGVTRFFKEELRQLGKMKFAEYMVLFYMITLVLLWFFLELDFMPGWAEKFPDGYVTMSVPAGIISVFIMLTPSELPWNNRGTKSGRAAVDTLASWQDFAAKFPWGVMLMLGGGISIAKATKITGLSAWVAVELCKMSVIPVSALLVILCLTATLVTEVLANVVSVNILMPICATLAEALGKNPLYFILPVSLSCSFSFMLPMSSVVNAYIHSTGRVSVLHMIKAGSVINLAAVAVTLLAIHTWGMAYFNLDELPWPVDANTTTIPATV